MLIIFEGIVDVARIIIIIIFVVPFVIIALCCYLRDFKGSVDEFKQLPPEKKRREYKFCAAFCIIMWIAIVILMIVIDVLT